MRISAISNEIKSFRLGYNEEQPYPWRWTTPVVLCAFLLISPFLALVNVPLSAYNIIQEFTYHPNDTLPAVFLANIIPSVLQNPTDSFTPHILNVGDRIALNNYIFKYTISQAFDGVNPVPAFPYYNNPFSDSCDVANITVQSLLEKTSGVWDSEIEFSGTVVCSMPNLFHLTWHSSAGELLTRAFDSSFLWFENVYIGEMPTVMDMEFGAIFNPWRGPDPPGWSGVNFTRANINFTVHPCCKCEAVLARGPLESAASILESPCSSNPTQFVVVDSLIWAGDKQEPLAAWEPVSLPTKITDLFTGGPLGNVSISALSTAYGNLIQTFYHLVRLDLGVILPNQIYNSPEMFRRTIMPVEIANFPTLTNRARNLTSNATLMAQWQQEVKLFQNNTRVPPLEYLRSAPRLKPLGSAITSVFVSTFAMLSVMWTVFSLVAGALARKHSGRGSNDTLGKKQTLEQCERGERWLESGMQDVDESEVILLGQPREPDAVDRLTRRIDSCHREGVQTRMGRIGLL
ncbi:hypothetical protein MSAN_02305500 [Mycena sanguinolenta]|uniref:Transmembrane protein n=1 Tax=Mycena sanguinolenta TaxID=230812 RepID=A0A8H7CIE0_9AGAR|nr:hypothetical protein MSAN_02305500 [Mycena sanguinolenta]